MNSELPYPPMMPQAPQPVFQTPPVMHHTKPPTANEKQTGRKIKQAFYATLLFLLLSYVGVYRAMNVFYKAVTSREAEIVDEHGSPTLKGMVVHSIIFFFVMLFLIFKLQ